MNRFLSLILFLCVLSAQSAWAIHSVEFEDSQAHASGHLADQHDEGAGACGHNCHAGTHLIGFFTNNNIDFCDASDSHELTLDDLVSSPSYQPPVPPPTS